MAKANKTTTVIFRKRTTKKLGRHKKYRSKDFKAYNGQGK
jgi:hypothetical protein